MQRLTGLMEDVTERELARWPKDVPTPLHPRLQALTLEVILRAVFGLDPGSRLDGLRNRLTRILEITSNPGSVFPLLRRGPVWQRFLRLRRETDGLLFELIDERRSENGDREDVLSMLLSARYEDGSPMGDAELRDELMTLLVAGHETTASQLAWAFERLGRSPDVLGRLTEEIDAGDEETYLTATVQETLRHRPVLPNAAPRLVMRPVEIGGWEYPAGVCLIANGYLIHHDPAIYPDPYEFRPERFLSEPPGTYTWIPFGGGRRRCLGASFALLEMKIVLRAVLAQSRPVADGDGLTERSRRRAITLSPREGAVTALLERRPERVSAYAGR